MKTIEQTLDELKFLKESYQENIKTFRKLIETEGPYLSAEYSASHLFSIERLTARYEMAKQLIDFINNK